jgi:hypothetical protein
LTNSRSTNHFNSTSKQTKTSLYVQSLQLHSWIFQNRDREEVVDFATATSFITHSFTFHHQLRRMRRIYHQMQTPIPTLPPITTTTFHELLDLHSSVAILSRLLLTNDSLTRTSNNRHHAQGDQDQARRQGQAREEEEGYVVLDTSPSLHRTDILQTPTHPSVVSPPTCSSPTSSVRTSVMRTLVSLSVRITCFHTCHRR